MTKRQFDIANAFLNLQDQLIASHRSIRAVTRHGPTIGDESEIDWIGLIRAFLPSRYQVGPIFAVDHNGAMSEQIDVAIFDQQYTPLWFGARNGTMFVPVEAVYAIFEVKPELNRSAMEAAIGRVRSVRALKRTSAPIVHAGGRLAPVDPESRPILGGILTATLGWKAKNAQERVRACLSHLRASDLIEGRALDIGIATDKLSFDFTPTIGDDGSYPRLRSEARSLSAPRSGSSSIRDKDVSPAPTPRNRASS